MSGGQNYLLLTLDMAKVGSTLSVVKVCTSMLCKNSVSVPVASEGVHTILNMSSPLPATLVFCYFFVGCSYITIVSCGNNSPISAWWPDKDGGFNRTRKSEFDMISPRNKANMLNVYPNPSC